jgi:hypothetical protein
MADLTVVLSLTPVGPREDLASRDRWPFCLRLSAGYSAEPTTDTERREWAKALLPWRLFATSGLRAYLSIKGQIFDKVTVDVEPPIALSDFTTALKDDVEKTLLTASQLNRYRYSFVMQATSTTVSEDGPILSGLLHGLADLPPALSQGVRAAWFFELDRTWLTKNTDPKVQLLAAPRALVDSRVAATLPILENSSLTEVIAERVYGVQYSTTIDSTTINATASGEVISISGLQKAATGPLKTYWLPVSDGRHQPLSEIGTELGRALDPVARVSATQLAALTSILTITPQEGVDTTAVATLIGQHARAHWVFLVPKTPKEQEDQRRLRVREFLDAALAKRDPAVDPLTVVRAKLRDDLAAFWTFKWTKTTPSKTWLDSVLDAAKDAPEMAGVSAIDGNGTADFAQALLDILLPLNPADEPRPSLPNESLHFRVGAPEVALLHEDEAQASNSGDLAQIAALGALVRRSSSKDFTGRSWRLVTAGIGVLDPDGKLKTRPFGQPTLNGNQETLTHTPDAIARGLTTAFEDGVLKSELLYRGEHPGTSPVLRFVHRDTLENQDRDDQNQPLTLTRLSSLTFEAPGLLGDAITYVEHTLAPAFRYGDWLEVAVPAFDRTGGMPALLDASTHGVSGNDSFNPVFKWSALSASLQPPGAVPVEFLRRVPVGELNLLAKNEGDDWPTPPSGVTLRCREWIAARLKAADNAPVLVLGDPSIFTDGTDRKRDAPAMHAFRVDLPRVDEFTLSRWAMPPVGSDAASAAPLKDELARIFTERDALLEKEAPDDTEADKKAARMAATTLLPHEPAVAAVGIRVTIVDSTGNEITKTFTQPVVRTTPFAAKALTFTVSLSGTAAGPIDWSVPAGSFASIELRPLVAFADYARFEHAAMKELVDAEVWDDTNGQTQKKYRAFAASRVLVESADALLPDAQDLYNALSLELDTVGAVRVLLDDAGVSVGRRPAFREAMTFVDKFSVPRERWRWRNLPLLDPDATPPDPKDSPAAIDDWRRLATSGLPQALWDAAKRDTDEHVHRFDVIASTDRGFVKRAVLSGVLPRGGSEPLSRALLGTDDRDAIASADYLRFGLIVRSRYAGMFRSSSGSEQTARKAQPSSSFELSPRWRRSVAPFRGGRDLKPLRILAVLPLTRMPKKNPFPGLVSNSATGFLVVLDESWFREYGEGESLEAYLTLEPREIGDNDANGNPNPNPFRAAPLPDHHVLPANPQGAKPYYRNSLATEDDEFNGNQLVGPRHPLCVYGPFGYTLDRADSQSLANATAFVVYPPPDVGPHWWMGVRVRRVLRSFDAEVKPVARRSEPSNIQNLYTLPGNLTSPVKLTSLLTLRKDRSIELQDLTLHLEPTPNTDAAVMKQYAYALVFGRRVADGGRGVDVLLPRFACWLDPGNADTWRPVTDVKQLPTGEALTGRVVEILLNGRPSQSPLLEPSTNSLQTLLMKLLPVEQDGRAPVQDSLGAARRISDEFTVIVL